MSEKKPELPKIGVTWNYDQFTVADDNRPLDLKRHRALERNMEEDGFIPGCPIICIRRSRKLIVKDGQHRLYFARKLGLPVYWIEVEEDFDVAKLNNAQKGWLTADYAGKFAEAGADDYKEVLQFREDHGVPITLAAALLAGVTTFGTVAHKFYAGEYKVTDREYARAVVAIYTPLIKIDKRLKHMQFLMACMAVARVKGFGAKRLLAGVDRARQKVVMFGSRDGYLAMLEELYNYGRGKPTWVPLKLEAQKEMAARNPRTRGKRPDDGAAEAA